MRITLCLLTWNEIEGCRIDVPDLPLELFSEVFALDGGSSDGTVEFLRGMGVSVVTQQVRSYNAAYREAIDHYTGDAIIFYHPKGTMAEGSLPSMVDALRAGNDLVIASRMLPSSRNEEDDRVIRHRKWFGIGLGQAASLRWNRRGATRISDPLHGYRGCSRKFTSSLTLQPTGVTADLEMVRHAYVTGARIAEVPVTESKRVQGGTHFPALSTGRHLVRYLLFPPS
jgi:hypothetical protein